MNEALVPNYLKEMEAEADLTQAQNEAVSQRRIAADLVIQAGGPEFWLQVLKELDRHTSALPKKMFRGKSSPYSHPQDTERSQRTCRVEIGLSGPFTDSRYTDLFYTPGSSRISCLTSEGEGLNFAFCVLPDGRGIGVIPDDYMRPINADAMVEMIIKNMIQKLRRMA